jgi:radical SAM protein with 4Fe4S-binding SPASM domain
MSDKAYQNLINKIVFDRKKSGELLNNFQIVFHGGEPTLAGVQKVKQCIDFARQKMPKVTFGIQTNLTTITDEWIALFVQENISVGTSIDTVKKTDKSLRSENNQAIIENYHNIRTAGVQLGSIMVVNQTNKKKFRHNAKALRKELRLECLKANYVENVNNPGLCFPELSGKELYQYMFLPIMKDFLGSNSQGEDNISHMLLLFFADCVKNGSTPPFHNKSNCHTRWCKGGIGVIESDPDGAACFCGRWSEVNKDNTLGDFNQLRSDIFGIGSFSRIIALHRQKIQSIRALGCDTCRAKIICDYGCIAFSYTKFNKQPKIRKEIVCDYYTRVYDFFLDHFEPLLIKYLKQMNIPYTIKNKIYYFNVPKNKLFFSNAAEFNLPKQKKVLIVPQADHSVQLAIAKN